MILLDTQAWIRFVLQPAELSKRATGAIRRVRSRDGLALSAVSCWEAGWLIRTGRVRASFTPRRWIDEAVTTSSVHIVPVSLEVALCAVELPASAPSDPCDRLIVATALERGWPLVTSDERIRASRWVETIW